MPTQKPYRPNVGIALFNPAGLVLIGHRFRGDGPEIILPGLEWQMPQGGVDAGEDLRATAARALSRSESVSERARKPLRTMWSSITWPMAASRLGTYRPPIHCPPCGSNTAFSSSTTNATSPPRRKSRPPAR